MSAVVSRFIVLFSLCLLLTTAFPHNHARDHTDVFTRILPGKWYHDDSHPVSALFKRDNDAQPGTAEWAAQYPPSGAMPLDSIPQAWLDALHAAEEAGLIPNITVSTASNGSPVYSPTDDPDGPVICSSTWKCRMPDDIWDAPDGYVAIGFDDGPYDGSDILYDFLQQKNIPSTHFMIGTNIINGYDLFQRAFSELKSDIAVHTWTHRLMTSLTNEIVLGELAWTMQIIADLTGGRVPRYWRPPSGDSDNRVRAIAKHVLNLTQINWNQDSEDWRMNVNQVTFDEVKNNITTWYAGPQSPGLIILEHELSPNTSQAFIDTYPDIQAHGWHIESTLRLFGDSYQNSADDVSSVEQESVVPPATTSSSTSASSSVSASLSVTGINQVGHGVPTPKPSDSAPTSNANSNAAVCSRLASPFPLPLLLLFSMLFI